MIDSLVPNLRVFRVVDESKLSDYFIDANQRFEGGTLPYIDVDRPRDIELTEEIMEHTIGAVVVNEDGDVVAEFQGKDAWKKAEAARKSAKITFNLEIPEEKPKPGTRPAVQAMMTTEDDEELKS